jgi:hypothetical protein
MVEMGAAAGTCVTCIDWFPLGLWVDRILLWFWGPGWAHPRERTQAKWKPPFKEWTVFAQRGPPLIHSTQGRAGPARWPIRTVLKWCPDVAIHHAEHGAPTQPALYEGFGFPIHPCTGDRGSNSPTLHEKHRTPGTAGETGDIGK